MGLGKGFRGSGHSCHFKSSKAGTIYKPSNPKAFRDALRKDLDGKISSIARAETYLGCGCMEI